MSHLALFDESVSRENYQNAELRLSSAQKHSQYDPDMPRLKPTERMIAKISRWMGEILVTGGEKLLRYAD